MNKQMPPRDPKMAARWPEDASRLPQACPNNDRRNFPEIAQQKPKTSPTSRLRNIHPIHTALDIPNYCNPSEYPRIHPSGTPAAEA